jgi:hypothetical protein
MTANARGQLPTDGSIRCVVMEREKIGTEKRVNFSPYSEAAILSALTDGGLTATLEPTVPLISREVVQYTLVSTAGAVSALTGFVHLETGADGSLSFLSDRGERVVLKTQVNAVHWMIDKPKAQAEAHQHGDRYVLLAEVESEDITEQLSQKDLFGGQRSYAVTLAASLTDAASGKVVRAYQGRVTKMDAVQSGAIQDAAAELAGQMAAKFTSPR